MDFLMQQSFFESHYEETKEDRRKLSRPYVNEFVLKSSIRRPISDDFMIDPSKVLGRGYTGKVVVALNRSTKVPCAVKTYAVRGDRAKLDSARRECHIYTQIDHPNIGRMFHVYEDGSNINIALELYTGGDLYHRLTRSKRFSEARAQETTRQMVLAIDYLHRRNIVHRDIKLENWLYASKSEKALMKLCDFGFARFWDQAKPMHTRCGSRPYMDPEVFNGKYTSKCDTWSLGVVVYALLMGAMPFKRLRDIKSGQYLQDNDTWCGLSEKARDFVKKLLVVSSAHRLAAAECCLHVWVATAGKNILEQTTSTLQELSAHSGSSLQVIQDRADYLADSPHSASTTTCDVATDIVQTLLTCKQLHVRNETPPLADEEYDKLMELYARLTGNDVCDIFEQLQVFRSGVGQLKAAVRLYDVKLAALKGRVDPGIAASIKTLDDGEYDEKKSRVKRLGDGLLGTLQRLHHDPVLKSAVSDAEYDRLVNERRMLDTVMEERLEESEITSAGKGIYLNLVEVQGYKHLYHSGKTLVPDGEYKKKKTSAINNAQAFLQSADSCSIDESTKNKIAKIIADLATPEETCKEGCLSDFQTFRRCKGVPQGSISQIDESMRKVEFSASNTGSNEWCNQEEAGRCSDKISGLFSWMSTRSVTSRSSHQDSRRSGRLEGQVSEESLPRQFSRDSSTSSNGVGEAVALYCRLAH